ncbi:hypothetical protein ACFLR4_04655 [Bacteroidota bacterium]
MNTGQMLITIGAMTILSLVIVRVSSTLIITSDVMDRSKIGLLAVSMATSIIEEVNSVAFDENTISGSVTASDGLSEQLCAEALEVYPDFDDLDDYNDFRYTPKIDTIDISGINFIVFQTFCAVDYVVEGNPELISVQSTFDKRLEVKVTSPAMWNENAGRQDTITLNTLFSYWYFR